jgi:ribosomal protein S3
MQQRPQIKVNIGLDGKLTMTVVGVKGAACQELTRELLKKLGTVEKQEVTAEFYESPTEIVETVRDLG